MPSLHLPNGKTLTTIPKNGSTTLTVSVAIALGLLTRPDRFNWALLPDSIYADNTDTQDVVFLRCPYRRLVSAFLHRVVMTKLDTMTEALITQGVDIEDLTFESFVKSLQDETTLEANIHWKPQTSQMGEGYSDFFCVESFDTDAKMFQDKYGVQIVDPRRWTEHTTFGLKKAANNGFTRPVKELRSMMQSGVAPIYAGMFTDELVGIVTKLYSKDLSLYSQVIGPEKLLFKEGV